MFFFPLLTCASRHLCNLRTLQCFLLYLTCTSMKATEDCFNHQNLLFSHFFFFCSTSSSSLTGCFARAKCQYSTRTRTLINQYAHFACICCSHILSNHDCNSVFSKLVHQVQVNQIFFLHGLSTFCLIKGFDELLLFVLLFNSDV